MEEAEISFVIHPSQKEMLWQKAGADEWMVTAVAVKLPKPIPCLCVLEFLNYFILHFCQGTFSLAGINFYNVQNKLCSSWIGNILDSEDWKSLIFQEDLSIVIHVLPPKTFKPHSSFSLTKPTAKNFFAMGNSFMRLCNVGKLIYLLWSVQIWVKPGPRALWSKKTEMCVLSSAHGLLVWASWGVIPLSISVLSLINDGCSSICVPQLLVLNYSLIGTEINSIKVLSLFLL